MLPRRLLAVMLIVSAVWIAVALGSMMYGTQLNWPDYVHVNYGIPLTFATHTLNTIIGPVDRWSVDIPSLSFDLLFWLVGTAAILMLTWYLSQMKRTS